jgi:hypothetical protein
MVIINVLMIVYFRRRSRPYKKPEAGKDQAPTAQTSIENKACPFRNYCFV